MKINHLTFTAVEESIILAAYSEKVQNSNLLFYFEMNALSVYRFFYANRKNIQVSE